MKRIRNTFTIQPGVDSKGTFQVAYVLLGCLALALELGCHCRVRKMEGHRQHFRSFIYIQGTPGLSSHSSNAVRLLFILHSLFKWHMPIMSLSI